MRKVRRLEGKKIFRSFHFLTTNLLTSSFPAAPDLGRPIDTFFIEGAEKANWEIYGPKDGNTS
jgi:hypothetical protein